MKRTPRNNRGDSAILWLPSIVALCAGWYIVFGLLGGAVDLQMERVQALSSVALSHAETLAQRPLLQRQERQVDDRLHVLELEADTPTTVARFIHAATRIVTANHVNLSTVDERPATATAEASAAPGASGGTEFQAIPLDVTLNGDYPALLASIRELARAPVTMQIEIAAIERGATSSTMSNGPLSARLHIALQRLNVEAPSASTTGASEGLTIHARSL